MPKVLISDELSPAAIDIFKSRGVDVDVKTGLKKDQLLEIIDQYDGLAIRSATKVDKDVIAAAKNLKVVGRAGIGVDNVDIPAATAKGIVVMNTPFGNSITTAEHAIALMFAAARQVPEANASTQAGKWEKNRFMGRELYAKTLGLIGCGNIGSIVADRALGLKMKVVAYDPFLSPERAVQIGVEKVELDELLARADVITLHVPLTDKTKNVLSRENLAKTKKGVIIVNAARGGLVDEAALAEAVASGHVRAAGIDVFATEPCTDSPLFELAQVVVTPHLGASTAEAQDRAGTDVAASVKLALAGEFVPDAVNVGAGVVSEEVAPWLDLVRKLGVLVGVLSDELPVSLSVQVRGELASEDVGVLRLSALRGLFSAVIEDPVTFVNAPALAAERGVSADLSTASESPNHRSVVDVRAVASDGSVVNVAGTLSGPQQVQKIVQINRRSFDLRAQGINLVIHYIDQPGALGKIGTLLGAAGVNIHAAQLSEDTEGPHATIMLRLNRDVPGDVRSAISAAVGANKLEVVDLS